MEFDYNTKETRVGIQEGVSLEVELYAMRVLIKGGVWNKEWLFGELCLNRRCIIHNNLRTYRERKGTSKVRKFKIVLLFTEYEAFEMEKNESLQEMITRLNLLVNELSSLGKVLSTEE